LGIAFIHNQARIIFNWTPSKITVREEAGFSFQRTGGAVIAVILHAIVAPLILHIFPLISVAIPA